MSLEESLAYNTANTQAYAYNTVIMNFICIERLFMQNNQQVYLVLADGSVYQGQGFGASPKNEFAELVFTTGMSGYLETLTDPSFSAQIIMQTFPLIGNYGFIPQDLESAKVSCKGYVVRNLSRTASNFRAEGTLQAYLAKQGVVGIEGIDTRMLTRKIREEGVMNAVITSDPTTVDLEALQNFHPASQVPEVSVKETRTWLPVGQTRFRVAIPDTGVKKSIITNLVERGCEVTLFPYNTDPKAILAGSPDGILLGNGPGDPRQYHELIENTKILASSGLPLMGICLGHQLLALAHGFTIQKMKYGHRGENQGVQDLQSGRIYMTAQNHGYLVDTSSMAKGAKVRFRNVNDGSCEGLDYEGKPQFSVQFHPEASGGPEETRFLFERFISLMEAKDAAR